MDTILSMVAVVSYDGCMQPAHILFLIHAATINSC